MRTEELALLAGLLLVVALATYLVFDPFGAREPAPATGTAVLESPPAGATESGVRGRGAGAQPSEAAGLRPADPGRALESGSEGPEPTRVPAASRKLRVYGTVTSTRGEPLSGARVTPLEHISAETQTDAQGSYEVLLSPEHRISSFRVRLEGYRDGLGRPAAVAGASRELRLDVRLEPVGATVVVAGTVSTADGLPVPGESISLYSQNLGANYRGVSDMDGRFLIPDVEVGEDYQVLLRPKGMFRDNVRQSVVFTRDEFLLDIVLEPLATGQLTGRMLDESGQPIPHFRIWLSSREALGRFFEVAGDEAGHFEVDEAPEGSLTFRTRASPQLRVDGIHLSAGERQELRLVLDWGDDAIRGRVLDERGSPVAGAEVSLQWSHQSSGLRSSSTRTTSSDDLGVFRFTQLGPGLHQVDARAPGYIPARWSYEVGSDSGELELRLERMPQ